MTKIIKVAIAPNQDFPEDFPGDEDLVPIGEVPSPQEIEQPPPGLTPTTSTQFPVVPRPTGKVPKVPRGQVPGQPYYEVAPFEFLPVKPPGPEAIEDPSALLEEVVPPETPVEEMNRIYDVRQKLWYSLNNNVPLRVQYQTLPDEMGGSSMSERVIEPDYVYWAGTERHILVAWCYMRNDWRAFAVDRILDADLVEEGQ